MNKYAVKARLARVYCIWEIRHKQRVMLGEVINNSGLRLVRDNREDVSL